MLTDNLYPLPNLPMPNASSSQDLLLQIQTSTGRRQQLLLSLLKLQMLVDSGDNLFADQRSVIEAVVCDLQALIPAKPFIPQA